MTRFHSWQASVFAWDSLRQEDLSTAFDKEDYLGSERGQPLNLRPLVSRILRIGVKLSEAT